MSYPPPINKTIAKYTGNTHDERERERERVFRWTVFNSNST